MINRQGFYCKNAQCTYRCDGTNFSPYINGDFRQKATRAYKFDGIYFMKYENGNFVKNRPRTYKYEGNYFMAYSNGYKRDIDGSFKLDGRYIIPYDHFNKFKPTNRNTYEVYHGEIAPRYYADFAEK